MAAVKLFHNSLLTNDRSNIEEGLVIERFSVGILTRDARLKFHREYHSKQNSDATNQYH